MYQAVVQLAAEIVESALAPHRSKMESYWYPGRYWPAAASSLATELTAAVAAYRRRPGRQTRAALKAARRQAIRVCDRYGLWWGWGVV
jgi:hypothetical protein